MIEDRNPLVRAAVSRNLALLIACLDTGEKYAQVGDFLNILYCSNSQLIR